MSEDLSGGRLGTRLASSSRFGLPVRPLPPSLCSGTLPHFVVEGKRPASSSRFGLPVRPLPLSLCSGTLPHLRRWRGEHRLSSPLALREGGERALGWRSYDTDAVADLFTEDAAYAYHPWDEPIRGRDAIVTSWMSDRDEPNSWSADYRPFVVSGNRAVAVGETRYADGKNFVNAWQLIFDRDARCSDFVEWYMTPPVDLELRTPLGASAPIDNSRGREGDRCP